MRSFIFAKMLKQHLHAVYNARLLTAISDHLGEVNLNNFVHPTSDQLKACFDILPSLSNFDANSGNLAASDCKEGGKEGGGGYRSRFTENKAALSQFTKNTTLAFYASRKIRENFLENHGSRRLWKLRFTRKTLAISDFTGKKKGPSRVTKIPFTTLCKR